MEEIVIETRFCVRCQEYHQRECFDNQKSTYQGKVYWYIKDHCNGALLLEYKSKMVKARPMNEPIPPLRSKYVDLKYLLRNRMVVWEHIDRGLVEMERWEG